MVLGKKLISCIGIENLPLETLIMIYSDGPNVNKKVWSEMSALKKKKSSKELANIETCNIHAVHNALMKGLQEFGEESSDFVVILRYFFPWMASKM